MKFGQICMMALLLFSSMEATKMQKPAEQPLPPEGPRIRVLVAKSIPAFLLEAKGAYRVIREDMGYQISSGLVGKRYIVHGIKSGLRWGEEFPGVSSFTVFPANRQTVFYVNGYQYKGAIKICLDKDRMVTVINEVSIEDYLRSTLAVKYDEALSEEAMAAMTIGARTEAYAVAMSGRIAAAPWDVVAADVGYFGNGVAMQFNGVEKSVDHTRFMVMEGSNGAPIADVKLVPGKVEELADSGLDAKRILRACVPHSRLNVTTDPVVR